MAVVMMCLPLLALARALPRMAKLLDSVPPEVNTISFSLHRKVLAMMAEASFTYCSASTPFWCMEEGFP